ncbi:MAG: nitroreductase family protein, partial [Deltaproteobacteria bacterium]|nr:nitroreductase family protein [Deltaproteobacteria bacterium]
MSLLKNILALFTGKPRPKITSPLLRLILNRRSCRAFTNAPITGDELDTILEAGRFAPSTVNLQTWSFFPFSREQWRETFERP